MDVLLFWFQRQRTNCCSGNSNNVYLTGFECLVDLDSFTISQDFSVCMFNPWKKFQVTDKNNETVNHTHLYWPPKIYLQIFSKFSVSICIGYIRMWIKFGMQDIVDCPHTKNQVALFYGNLNSLWENDRGSSVKVTGQLNLAQLGRSSSSVTQYSIGNK